MAADVELLPLPEWTRRDDAGQNMVPSEIRVAVSNYARANVLHHTTAQAAEIEALRAERNKFRNEYIALWADFGGESEARSHAEARAERLAEALREALIDLERSQANMRNAAKTDPRWEGCAEAIQPRVDSARALLRDQEEGRARD